MSDAHADDPGDPMERMLIEVMAGDRPIEDAEVRAAASADPGFAAALAELRSLRSRLDVAGRRERELLAAAAALPAEGTDARLAATIRRLAGSPEGGSRRRLLAWGALAAAAALLVVWMWGGFDGRAPSDDGQQLGDARLMLSTRPTADGGFKLSWTCAVPARSFRITIYDPADPAAPEVEVAEEIDPQVNEWTIGGEVAATLPEGARWRLHARIPGRELQRSAPLR